LASVTDVFNAILVRGDAVGDTVFYGRGAGKFPTASAVVADVIDCAKHTDKRKLIGWDDAENDYVINPFEQSSSLYIRAGVSDYNMVAEKVKALFNDVQILESDNKNEIAFVTPLMCEKDARAKIDTLDVDVKNILRVLDY
jgi:homoserine dehydrogenase